MGGDRLDAQLEPIAQFLLLIIVLLFVAAISSYLLSKAAARRRERQHNRLSSSKRTKNTSIDLFAKPETADRSSGSRRRSSKSSTHHIDILKRPEEPGESGPGDRSE